MGLKILVQIIMDGGQTRLEKIIGIFFFIIFYETVYAFCMIFPLYFSVFFLVFQSVIGFGWGTKIRFWNLLYVVEALSIDRGIERDGVRDSGTRRVEILGKTIETVGDETWTWEGENRGGIWEPWKESRMAREYSDGRCSLLNTKQQRHVSTIVKIIILFPRFRFKLKNKN